MWSSDNQLLSWRACKLALYTWRRQYAIRKSAFWSRLGHRLQGYLARTRHGIKRLRTGAMKNELCCDEEMEISSYVSWLIDGEMGSPLYHEEKYRASLLFASSVLTGHVFLHQLV